MEAIETTAQTIGHDTIGVMRLHGLCYSEKDEALVFNDIVAIARNQISELTKTLLLRREESSVKGNTTNHGSGKGSIVDSGGSAPSWGGGSGPEKLVQTYSADARKRPPADESIDGDSGTTAAQAGLLLAQKRAQHKRSIHQSFNKPQTAEDCSGVCSADERTRLLQGGHDSIQSGGQTHSSDCALTHFLLDNLPAKGSESMCPLPPSTPKSTQLGQTAQQVYMNVTISSQQRSASIELPDGWNDEFDAQCVDNSLGDSCAKPGGVFYSDFHRSNPTKQQLGHGEIAVGSSMGGCTSSEMSGGRPSKYQVSCTSRDTSQNPGRTGVGAEASGVTCQARAGSGDLNPARDRTSPIEATWLREGASLSFNLNDSTATSSSIARSADSTGGLSSPPVLNNAFLTNHCDQHVGTDPSKKDTCNGNLPGKSDDQNNRSGQAHQTRHTRGSVDSTRSHPKPSSRSNSKVPQSLSQQQQGHSDCYDLCQHATHRSSRNAAYRSLNVTSSCGDYQKQVTKFCNDPAISALCLTLDDCEDFVHSLTSLPPDSPTHSPRPSNPSLLYKQNSGDMPVWANRSLTLDCLGSAADRRRYTSLGSSSSLVDCSTPLGKSLSSPFGNAVSETLSDPSFCLTVPVNSSYLYEARHVGRDSDIFNGSGGYNLLTAMETGGSTTSAGGESTPINSTNTNTMSGATGAAGITDDLVGRLTPRSRQQDMDTPTTGPDTHAFALNTIATDVDGTTDERLFHSDCPISKLESLYQFELAGYTTKDVTDPHPGLHERRDATETTLKTGDETSPRPFNHNVSGPNDAPAYAADYVNNAGTGAEDPDFCHYPYGDALQTLLVEPPSSGSGTGAAGSNNSRTRGRARRGASGNTIGSPHTATTFNAGASGGVPPNQFEDDLHRMVFVSWIPRHLRAQRNEKRKAEVNLKKLIRSELQIEGLAKVLLFPPKGTHCKLVFGSTEHAAKFVARYGGAFGSEASEQWKLQICQACKLEMNEHALSSTSVAIEWAQPHPV